MRDWIYATILAVAAGAVVVGAATYSAGAAWIIAGILGAGWATLVFVVGEAGRIEQADLDDDVLEVDLTDDEVDE